jgi:hypothetical protein
MGNAPLPANLTGKYIRRPFLNFISDRYITINDIKLEPVASYWIASEMLRNPQPFHPLGGGGAISASTLGVRHVDEENAEPYHSRASKPL